MLPWNQAKISSEVCGFFKAMKVSYLDQKAHRCMCSDPVKAAQLFYRLLVSLHMGQFFNPGIIYIDSFSKRIILREVFPQRLIENCMAEIQCAQPVLMSFRPVILPFKLFPVPRTESNNLLLNTFESVFPIVAHTDVFFNGIVLVIRHVDGAVTVVGQAACDLLSVPLIRLDMISRGDWHRTRCKNDAIYLA